MSAFSTGSAPRREPRRAVALPVRLFGMDANGKAVNCECSTVDISAHGARVLATNQWRPGEIVGVRHGMEKGRFRVIWTGQPESTGQAQVGLQAIEISRYFWGANMLQAAAAPSTTSVSTRVGGVTDAIPHPPRLSSSSMPLSHADGRRHLRLRVNGGAKVVVNGTNHWGTVLDISNGGCYVECHTTYPIGEILYIKLTIEDFDFESDAVVRVTHRSMGMGLEFLRTSSIQRRSLEEFVAELARNPNRLRQ